MTKLMLFYEQDVGSKSSITSDTAFRKYLTLQVCTNFPSYASHVRPVSTWLGKRLKLRNVRVPLTNNTQFWVAPGESTSNPKAGHALRSASSVSTGFGIPVKPHMRTGPSPVKVAQPWHKSSCPKVVCKQLGYHQHSHIANGKSARATIRIV